MKGFELAYAQENGEDLSDYFRTGLKHEGNYLALPSAFEGDSDHQSIINNSDALQVMYTNHDLREKSETVLKRAVSIMFETLELSGYGEKKDSSGDYPTRFSFSDPWDTDSVLDQLVVDKLDEEVAGDKTESDPQDEPTEDKTESDSKNRDTDNNKVQPSSNGQSNEDDIEDEIIVAENDESLEGAEATSNDKETSQTSEKDNVVREVVINIDLHIDANEMDSAELGEKIEHINSLVDERTSDTHP